MQVSVNQIIGVMGMIYSNFSSRSRLIRQLEEKQKVCLLLDISILKFNLL